MSEREERRFVEIPRESVRLMAESTGLELSDEVAALLAEDVCYRLREATQVHSPSLSLPGTALSPQGFIQLVSLRPLLRALNTAEAVPSSPGPPPRQLGFQ